jgi:ATP-binding protein involved in chromosome partitioning
MATERGPARHSIAVGSGKGGVGKSTVSLNLALALVARELRVGLLDADLHGPNIPLMLGLKRETWTQYWTLGTNLLTGPRQRIEPIERFGLKVMSAGFILAEEQPMLLESMTLRIMLAQLVRQVAWGELDYLVVDLPPGTSDVQQSLLKEIGFSGALVVVTPQDVAHLDARKAIRMYERAGVPLLGAVENMSGIVCPHCGELIEVFPRVPDARSIWASGVERLISIPLEPSLSLAGDRGRPLLDSHPDSPVARAFAELAERLCLRLDGER